MRDWPLGLLIALAALVLALFPMRLNTMESYAYAAAAEGYYNLSATFALQQQGKPLPDISAYHPNHPLGHFIPAFFYRAFGIDALRFARGRNAVCALFFLLFFYLTARRLTRDPKAAAICGALVMSTYVFWSSALSGETQMPAIALIMAAVYFLLGYMDAERGNPRHLITAAALYILAGGCHLSSVMFAPPAGLALLLYDRRRARWPLYAGVAAAIVAGFLFFYVFLMAYILRIDSAGTWLRTIFIYSPMLVKIYASGEWWYLTGASLLQSLAYASEIARAGVVLFLLFGFFAVLRSQLSLPVRFLLIAWPAFQMVIQWLVQGRPDGLHFWLFLLPPFFLAGAVGLARVKAAFGNSLMAVVLLAVLGAGNFSVFLTASRAGPGDYLLFSPPGKSAEQSVAFVVYNPVLTFADIWAAGSLYGYREQRVFLPCCGEDDYSRGIEVWRKPRKNFLLVTDQLAGFSPPPGCQLVAQRLLQLKAGLIPVSVYTPHIPGQEFTKQIGVFACKGG